VRGFRGKNPPRLANQRDQRGLEASEDLETLPRRDRTCERREHSYAELRVDEVERQRVSPDLAWGRLLCILHARRDKLPNEQPHKADGDGQPQVTTQSATTHDLQQTAHTLDAHM
jgi:hypothetical protein